MKQEVIMDFGVREASTLSFNNPQS